MTDPISRFRVPELDDIPADVRELILEVQERRVRNHDPLVADRIATNERKASLVARERAMLEFALKVATASAEIEDAGLDRLWNTGFTEDEIWDIGAIAVLIFDRMPNPSNPIPRSTSRGVD